MTRHIIGGSVITEQAPMSVALVAGDAAIGDVDVLSSALPTGAATSALQGGGLPAALAANGGLKVEGVAGGVAISTMLVDELGVAYGVKHVENKPRVSSMPYLYDIAEGNVTGHTAVRRFGHNTDVGTALEVVSDTGGTQVYLAAAERLQVVSSDLDDDDGDTGARTVQVSGLDTNYALLQETVTLNGTANVTTTGSFIRVWQANVLTAGTTGTNEGTISIKDNAAANTLLVIQALEGQSHAARVTVPAGKTFYLAEWYGSEASSKGSEIHLFVRNFGGAWRSARVFVVLDNIFVHPSTVPLAITEKSDIEIRAKGLSAGANVTAGFDGWWE